MLAIVLLSGIRQAASWWPAVIRNAFRCKVRAVVVVMVRSPLFFKDAEGREQLLAVLGESVVAIRARVRQVDRPVQPNSTFLQHQDPVGQNNGFVDVVG